MRPWPPGYPGRRRPPSPSSTGPARASASAVRPSRALQRLISAMSKGAPPLCAAEPACSRGPASDKTDYLWKINNRLHWWAIRQILARSYFARARTCMLQPGAPNPWALTRRTAIPRPSARPEKHDLAHQSVAGILSQRYRAATRVRQRPVAVDGAPAVISWAYGIRRRRGRLMTPLPR